MKNVLWEVIFNFLEKQLDPFFAKKKYWISTLLLTHSHTTDWNQLEIATDSNRLKQNIILRVSTLLQFFEYTIHTRRSIKISDPHPVFKIWSDPVWTSRSKFPLKSNFFLQYFFTKLSFRYWTPFYGILCLKKKVKGEFHYVKIRYNPNPDTRAFSETLTKREKNLTQGER